MTTVADDGGDISPATWLNFVNSMLREGRSTWHCFSWVPWIRYVLTVIIVVVVVATAIYVLAGVIPAVAI